jgi:hypothetical protein
MMDEGLVRGLTSFDVERSVLFRFGLFVGLASRWVAAFEVQRKQGGVA